MLKQGKHDPQLSIESGYEVTDMNARVIVIAGVILAVSIVASVIISIFIVRGLDRRGPMNKTPGSPLTAELRTAPPGPLLQTTPVADKEKILAEAEAHLQGFGILDENPAMGRAYIPIEMAMDLVAEGKVEYRQAPQNALLVPIRPAAAPAVPAVDPTAPAEVVAPADDTAAAPVAEPQVQETP